MPVGIDFHKPVRASANHYPGKPGKSDGWSYVGIEDKDSNRVTLYFQGDDHTNLAQAVANIINAPRTGEASAALQAALKMEPETYYKQVLRIIIEGCDTHASQDWIKSIAQHGLKGGEFCDLEKAEIGKMLDAVPVNVKADEEMPF